MNTIAIKPTAQAAHEYCLSLTPYRPMAGTVWEELNPNRLMRAGEVAKLAFSHGAMPFECLRDRLVSKH